MGPRSDGRGQSVCRIDLTHDCHHLLQWGRDLTVADSVVRQAQRNRSSLCYTLQWGRDLTVADRRGVPSLRRLRRHLHASMGPRSDGRGQTFERVKLTDVDGKVRASMGPRSDGRGQERRNTGVPSQRQSVASMGPRSDGRGQAARRLDAGKYANGASDGRGPREACFNGAAI